MSVGSFVAGRSLCSYDPPGAVVAADLGLAEKGWKVSVTHAKQIIAESDGFGRQPIEGILQGFSGVFLEAKLLEWTAMGLRAALPYGQSAVPAAAYVPLTGAGYLSPGIIGRRDTDVAGILTFTAVAGTPAAAQPAGMGALYAAIAEDFPVEWFLNHEARTLPIRFRVYPWVDAVTDVGVTKYLTFT